jgi:lipoprotein-releasing system permease protein
VYHILLSNRYLTSRVIPLIAVAAVALCVALVIIVVSVMTGFLDMVKSSGRTLMGDVVVSYPITGLPFYDRLIERIEAAPEAAAASPVVDSVGLLKMPYPEGDRKHIEQVQVWGIHPESLARVTGYEETLHWRTPEDPEAVEFADFRRDLLDAIGPEGLDAVYENGRTLSHPDSEHAIVLGMHVSIGNERQKDGSYRPIVGPVGPWWMPRFDVVLTVVPIGSEGGLLNPETKIFRVVNEFVSGVFLIDEVRVMVPIEHAQKMMHLHARAITDEDGDETGFVDPDRATMVLVRTADAYTADELRAAVIDAYEQYRADLIGDDTVAPELVPPIRGRGVNVQTWRQQQAKFIDPIEKERELMRVLFSIIYLVCAGLVLSIFWAIVYEKTRDIGILRSVGGSRLGIGLIFLRYGAVIGAIGSTLGLGLAYLVVHNINAIHAAIGEPAPAWSWITAYALGATSLLMTAWHCFRDLLLPVVLWALATVLLAGVGTGLLAHRGTLIWDPTVYYFSEIPNVIDVVTAATTMIGAVVFSVLGSVIPATRAADTDPVRALRYE